MHRYICQEENFKYLNGRDVSQPGVLEIVGKSLDQDKDNLQLLQTCSANYKDIFQYVYSYTFTEMKSNFNILFKTYKDKQIIKQQQTSNETENAEIRKFEQKPLLKFNDEEELEMKEIRRQINRKPKAKFTEEEKAAETAKKT